VILARRLVGTHEIAEMFGVSRQRAQQIVARSDFPNPYDVLHMGKVWRRAAVEQWACEHGRTPAESD
jgi:predicted DNA-binding transcriptional regulator AlpA